MASDTQSWNAEAIEVAEHGLQLLVELGKEEGDAYELREEAEEALSKGRAAPQGPLLMVVHALAKFASTEMGVNAAEAKMRDIFRNTHALLWVAKDAKMLFMDRADQKGIAISAHAIACIHLGRIDEPDAPHAAIRAAEEAMSIFRELQDEQLVIAGLRALSDAHQFLATLSPFENVQKKARDEALVAAKELLDITRNSCDQTEQAKVIHSMAIIRSNSKIDEEMEHGLRLAEDAREVFQECGDKKLENAVQQTINNVVLDLEGCDEALQECKSAASRFGEDGATEFEAVNLRVGAEICLMGQAPDQGMTMATEALELFRKVQKPDLAASALVTIARLHVSLDKYEESYKALVEAVEIYHMLGLKRAEASALTELGEIRFKRMGDQIDADAHADKKGEEKQYGLTQEQIDEHGRVTMEYMDKATELWRELRNDEGDRRVGEIIEAAYQRSVDLYKELTPPTKVTHYLTQQGQKAKEPEKTWDLPPGLRREEAPPALADK